MTFEQVSGKSHQKYQIAQSTTSRDDNRFTSASSYPGRFWFSQASALFLPRSPLTFPYRKTVLGDTQTWVTYRTPNLRAQRFYTVKSLRLDLVPRSGESRSDSDASRLGAAVSADPTRLMIPSEKDTPPMDVILNHVCFRFGRHSVLNGGRVDQYCVGIRPGCAGEIVCGLASVHESAPGTIISCSSLCL